MDILSVIGEYASVELEAGKTNSELNTDMRSIDYNRYKGEANLTNAELRAGHTKYRMMDLEASRQKLKQTYLNMANDMPNYQLETLLKQLRYYAGNSYDPKSKVYAIVHDEIYNIYLSKLTDGRGR